MKSIKSNDSISIKYYDIVEYQNIIILQEYLNLSSKELSQIIMYYKI